MSVYAERPTSGTVAAASAVILVVGWNVFGRALRQHFLSKTTAVNDIPKLGQLSKERGKIRGTAVIAGGSIAGLWAARVCADHFEKVVVIEPETWVSPDQNKTDYTEYTAVEIREQNGLRTVINKRARVRQYHGTHGYQPIAVLAFRKLFPHFDGIARSMGMTLCPNELQYHLSGLPLKTPYHEYPEGHAPHVLIATRASLETLLRRLVRESDACHNVHFVNGTVTGIVPSSTRPDKLEGVQVRLDSQKEAQLMTGELFIDCTGPAQAFFKFLPREGYGSGGPKPLADLRLHYQQKMKYTCAQFHITPEMQAKLSAKIPPNPRATSRSYLEGGWDNATWLYVINPKAELDNKMSLAKKMEGGTRVEILFGGWGLEDVPRNKAQMQEFMRSMVMLPGYEFPSYVADIFDVLCDDSAEEPIVGIYPSPSSTYVQYHLASNLPSNFVATGDAVNETNPIFGQGCSKACIGAVTLNATLANVRQSVLPDDFGKKFFAAQAPRLARFWDTAKLQDYRFATTTPIAGEEKKHEKILLTQGGFMSAYMFTLLKLNQTDKYIASTLWHIFSLLAPATDVFSPRILAKVAWAKLRGVV